MTSEIDIYRSAQVLVKRHGEDAPIHAAMRADELLDGARRGFLAPLCSGAGPDLPLSPEKRITRFLSPVGSMFLSQPGPTNSHLDVLAGRWFTALIHTESDRRTPCPRVD